MPTCEDLATKAELQELRDQLNEVLGGKEDGGKVSLFEKGKSSGLLAAGAATTLLGMAKVNAPKVITDIAMGGTAGNVIQADFAKGKSFLQAVKGNGTTSNLVQLNKVTKVAGQGASVATVATSTAATAVGSVMLLATLVQIAGALALNKATVDIFDYRINQESAGVQQALNAQNESMLRLYEKNNNSIEAVNAEIAQNNQLAAQTRQSLLSVQADLSRQGSEIRTFDSKLATAQQQINQLQIENNKNIQKIEELSEELAVTKTDLTNQINTIALQLEEAIKIIESQKVDIEKINERITLYEARATEIETRMSEYEAQATELEANFAELKADLDLIKELNPSLITERATETEQRFSKVTFYENAEQTYKRLFEQHNIASDKVKKWSSIVRFELSTEIAERAARYEIQAKNYGFAPSVAPAAMGAAAAQTGVLNLAQKLTGTEAQPIEITEADLSNQPNLFQDILKDLLPQIGTEGMTQEQIDQLRTGLGTDFKGMLNASLATGVLPMLDTVNRQTQAPALRLVVEQGLCQSLNSPNACGVTPGNPNPTQGLKGMQAAAGAKADALLAAMGAADLVQGQSILGFVKNTNAVVNHAQHGLAKVQNFAQTAWKATQADKILAGVSMALTVHNAMMLSNNLLSTMSEATNMALNALNIRDETDDTPINFGALVKGKIAEVLTSILGAEQYALLTARIAKANRIYQASVNVLDTTQSLFDSARSVAELTAENTGKIGNALRESGVVYEDAYEEFAEKINPQNKAQRNLEKFRGTIEGVSNVFETIEGISSNIVEFQENATQLTTEKREWKIELDKKIEVKVTEKTEAKEEVQTKTEVNSIDFDSAPPEIDSQNI